MKWEYKTWRHHGEPRELENVLNNLGNKGWELITCQYTLQTRTFFVAMKREVPVA